MLQQKTDRRRVNERHDGQVSGQVQEAQRLALDVERVDGRRLVPEEDQHHVQNLGRRQDADGRPHRTVLQQFLLDVDQVDQDLKRNGSVMGRAAELIHNAKSIFSFRNTHYQRVGKE